MLNLNLFLLRVVLKHPLHEVKERLIKTNLHQANARTPSGRRSSKVSLLPAKGEGVLELAFCTILELAYCPPREKDSF